MKREHENIKEFKNGNLSIRFPSGYMDKLKKSVSAMEVLSWVLEELDCHFIGEEFCLNNYTTGVYIYNNYSDLIYTLAFSDILDVLANEHWLRLYARKPDEHEREIINGSLYD